MTNAEMKARKLIGARSTENLVSDFEATETSSDPNIYIVRGWIMDELQKRNAEAFDAWIDSEEESPRKFFISAA